MDKLRCENVKCKYIYNLAQQIYLDVSFVLVILSSSCSHKEVVWLETSFFFLLPITENPFPITQKTENIVDIFSFSFGVGLIKKFS